MIKNKKSSHQEKISSIISAKGVKNKSMVLAILGTFFIVLGVGAVLFYNNHNSAYISLPEPPTQSFETFVGNWNDKARAFGLSDYHRLSSIDNQKMLQQLHGYVERFAVPRSSNEINELNSIVKQYPSSIWGFYQRFLVSYTGKEYFVSGDWEGLFTSSDLRQRIQIVTSNRDYDESIKLLLASSDPCAFFAIYKYDLYKKGLSKNFRKCNAIIVDAVKHPSLAMLIR